MQARPQTSVSRRLLTMPTPTINYIEYQSLHKPADVDENSRRYRSRIAAVKGILRVANAHL